MTPPTGPGRRRRADRGLALGLATIAAAGLLHLGLASLREGPGAGGWIVPLLCYLSLLLAAACLSCSAGRETQESAARERAPLLPVLVAAACAAAYFQAVLALGLAIATFVAAAAAIIVLSADRRAAWLRAVVIGALAAVAFYVVFGRLAPIVLDATLLF